MEYSDFELVHAIKRGDSNALDVLVRRWYPRIYGYIFKLIGHEQDAYDLTQDVFIAMMQGLPNYRPWKKLDSWLFTIAHNKCMDYFRMQRRTVLPYEVCLNEQTPPPDETVAVSVAVREALAKLPAVQQEAVILHYFQQYTAEEIAEMTGTPLPTIKSRLRAARKVLSKDLGKKDFQ